MLPTYIYIYYIFQVKMFNEFSYTNISSVEFDLCFKCLNCIILYFITILIIFIDLNNMKIRCLKKCGYIGDVFRAHFRFLKFRLHAIKLNTRVEFFLNFYSRYFSVSFSYRTRQVW